MTKSTEFITFCYDLTENCISCKREQGKAAILAIVHSKGVKFTILILTIMGVHAVNKSYNYKSN